MAVALRYPITEDKSSEMVPANQQWREHQFAFATQVVMLRGGAHWHIAVVRMLDNSMVAKPQDVHIPVMRKKLGGLLKHRGVGRAEVKMREGVMHAWKQCSSAEKDRVDEAFERMEAESEQQE